MISLLITLLTIWVVFSLLMVVMLRGKPAWMTFPHGGRKEVHAPIGRFLICSFIVGFMMVSLVPHLIFRGVGRRGFYNKAEKSYTTQNPFKRTER